MHCTRASPLVPLFLFPLAHTQFSHVSTAIAPLPTNPRPCGYNQELNSNNHKCARNISNEHVSCEIRREGWQLASTAASGLTRTGSKTWDQVYRAGYATHGTRDFYSYHERLNSPHALRNNRLQGSSRFPRPHPLPNINNNDFANKPLSKP
jgi:hypothetical protein